jgi:uncharacterized membrane protein YedE/YeeE
VRALVVAFVSGLLFAAGLGLSGMAQPAKVIGFLDVFGDWDPSLAFVMAGALAVHLPAVWLYRRRRPAPIVGTCGPIAGPRAERVDVQVITGAALFGIGWGIGGYCPGPALVTLPGGGAGVLTFVAAMVVGILVHDRARRASVVAAAAAEDEAAVPAAS